MKTIIALLITIVMLIIFISFSWGMLLLISNIWVSGLISMVMIVILLHQAMRLGMYIEYKFFNK